MKNKVHRPKTAEVLRAVRPNYANEDLWFGCGTQVGSVNREGRSGAVDTHWFVFEGSGCSHGNCHVHGESW